MMELKKTYEKSQSKMKPFREYQAYKNKFDGLLTKVEENNMKIHELMQNVPSDRESNLSRELRRY